MWSGIICITVGLTSLLSWGQLRQNAIYLLMQESVWKIWIGDHIIYRCFLYLLVNVQYQEQHSTDVISNSIMFDESINIFLNIYSHVIIPDSWILKRRSLSRSRPIRNWFRCRLKFLKLIVLAFLKDNDNKRNCLNIVESYPPPPPTHLSIPPFLFLSPLPFPFNSFPRYLLSPSFRF